MVCVSCFEPILRTDWLHVFSLKRYCDGCLRVQKKPPQTIVLPFFKTHTSLYMTFHTHPLYDHRFLSLQIPPWELNDWLACSLEALACALALTYEDGWVLYRSIHGDDEAKIQAVQDEKIVLLQ